jgi:hypothetical protein
MASRRIIVAIVLGLLLVPSAIAQLAPQWQGIWQRSDGEAVLAISPSRMISEFKVEDEPGKFREVKLELEWTSSRNTDSPTDGTFGYSNKKISPSDVSRIFESAVKHKQKGDPDFSVSDPKSSRHAIKTMSPGVYKVMWSYSGGDCGYSEYILDGDRMLEVSECKYGVGVMLYIRKK